MATFMVISERTSLTDPCPHCAICINGSDWYGFKPSVHHSPVGKGVVDRNNLAEKVKLSVTFQVSNELIHAAVTRIVRQYESQLYILTRRDCVSFAADVAEAVGLKIPPRPNFLPDNLVMGLQSLNR